jgi:hypothetical protein
LAEDGKLGDNIDGEDDEEDIMGKDERERENADQSDSLQEVEDEETTKKGAANLGSPLKRKAYLRYQRIGFPCHRM